MFHRNQKFSESKVYFQINLADCDLYNKIAFVNKKTELGFKIKTNNMSVILQTLDDAKVKNKQLKINQIVFSSNP